MNILTISRQGRFFAAIQSRSVPPLRYSIARKTWPLVDADVEDADDVRVRQLGDRLRLAHQARLAPRLIALALVRAQELERDLAIELRIVGGVDDAHRAGAEPLEHQVAAEDVALLQDAVAGRDRRAAVASI